MYYIIVSGRVRILKKSAVLFKYDRIQKDLMVMEHAFFRVGQTLIYKQY